MLPERAFAIGGAVVIALGLLMAGATVAFGVAEVYWPFAAGAVIMVGFGVFFLYVGREARQDRLELVAIPGEPGREPPRGGGR